jgi:outer membrane protein OmpA-like peptidoglycan-associated protein
VLLIGRTDSTGGANSNMQLGLQRAHEFRTALLNKGAGKIDHSRVHIGSRGQAEPTASNEHEERPRRTAASSSTSTTPTAPRSSPASPTPIIIEGE